MRQKIKILFQEFTITSAGSRSINGKSTILTCLMFLVFILLNLSKESFADAGRDDSLSFRELYKRIQKKDICEIGYNPSRTAAIVNLDCGSAVYINFKTKKTYDIIDHWPNVFPVTWVTDTIAHIQGPCGTGCSKSIIFVAPAITVSCAVHEYRIKNLNLHEPPDYYNNRPLLIDPKKGLYVCYDEADNIQVFPLPQHASIRPPQGYFSEKAEIRGNQLTVIYKNKQGKIKKIIYGKV